MLWFSVIKRSLVDCQGHELILDVGGASAVDIPVFDIGIHQKTDGKRIVIAIKSQWFFIIHLFHLIKPVGNGLGFHIFDTENIVERVWSGPRNHSCLSWPPCQEPCKDLR